MIYFEANITVGIRGCALNAISASLSAEEEKKWKGDYTPREILIEYIDSVGLDEWYDYEIIKRLDEKLAVGNYKITGEAWWDSWEDPDFNYGNIKAIKQQ